MSLLPIVLHPDPRLKKMCDPVVKITDEIRALADNMLETMYDAPGIGLAAPQVGVANLMAAVWFLIMLLFGGFLVNIQTISPGYAWIRYISIFYYTFEILITNELTNVMLTFNAPGYPAIPIEGEVFLKTIGMEADYQMRNISCLMALTVGFALLSYILLCLRVPASTSTISPK